MFSLYLSLSLSISLSLLATFEDMGNPFLEDMLEDKRRHEKDAIRAVHVVEEIGQRQ